MGRLSAAVVLIGVAAAGAAAGASCGGKARVPSFRTVALVRGGITVTVSSSGTVSPVTTVNVGAQVSGQITELHADFNTHVTKGQLIARLDPAPSQLGVHTAEAAVERCVADSMLKAFTYQQAVQLHGTGMMTDNDFVSARVAFEESQQSLRAARVGLASAEQDLAYTYIYAPIDGVVTERDVQIGQTVASSYAAPQLLVIASDLRKMQILVQVDEADISQIKQGQVVRFTVAAYPTRTYQGTVSQVRLQSATPQNVVDYTVAVAVDNRDLTLLPGMTATVSFEVATAADVLKVANAALQFVPPASVLARYAAAHRGQAVPGTASDARTGAHFWYLDDSGAPALAMVRTGLTDGQSTEISGAGVAAGLRAIVGLALTGPAATPASASQGQTGPPPGPPPPGPPPGGPPGGR